MEVNFLRVKHRYQFVLRLKIIKYIKDIFCYLSSHIKFLTSSYNSILITQNLIFL